MDLASMDAKLANGEYKSPWEVRVRAFYSQ